MAKSITGVQQTIVFKLKKSMFFQSKRNNFHY
jgi:hypothetical protein